MMPVKSVAIHSVGYDAETRDLTVRFKSGVTYCYHDVAPEKHAALMKAKSLGTHFLTHIRDAHKSTKVAGKPLRANRHAVVG